VILPLDQALPQYGSAKIAIPRPKTLKEIFSKKIDHVSLSHTFASGSLPSLAVPVQLR
jgi:hypothetical protein